VSAGGVVVSVVGIGVVVVVRIGTVVVVGVTVPPVSVLVVAPVPPEAPPPEPPLDSETLSGYRRRRSRVLCSLGGLVAGLLIVDSSSLTVASSPRSTAVARSWWPRPASSAFR
jgi:hypothetical protein